jgi:hypothetical protein
MSNTFGLPLSPFDPKSETVAASKNRLEKVKAPVFLLFELAKWHLGEKDARKLFISAAKGREGKRRNTEIAFQLLRLYDALVTGHPSRVSVTPRLIAEKLHKEFPGEFGLSAPAIEKKLRRALIVRKRKDTEAIGFGAMFRSAGMLVHSNIISLQRLQLRLALYPRTKKRSATNQISSRKKKRM